MRTRSVLRFLSVGGATVLVGACNSSTAPTPPAVALASVAPRGGATAVSTSGTTTVTFTDSMMAGTEAYMSMRQGSVSGLAVPMTAHWSGDHMALTMTSNAPLTPGTTYSVHMGGGMKDANGAPIDYGACPGLGGQTATGGMMGRSMAIEIGTGWMGSDGNYGMVFSLTTA